MRNDPYWRKLESEIINQNLCTQCGSCVGLSNGILKFKEFNGVPLPFRTEKSGKLPKICYEACPAKYCSYPNLNKFVFNKIPKNWLCGVVKKQYIAHAKNEKIRRNGASGGLISSVLIHLLDTGKITGAICVEVGVKNPYSANPVIVHTKKAILRCAQSVYSVTPVNVILRQLKNEKGPLAFVGLPDQVASIRKLQSLGNHDALKIKYIIGPYMGTQMYFEAIRSFLRSHGVKSEEEISDLKYRAGEWPGYLQIKLKDGRVLKAEKFYYNYLIPFFITRSSLQLVDFTNELTDISVGDAWSPKFESQRGGFSVALARSKIGVKILEEMEAGGKAVLKPISLSKALDMHGHMIDFKKRGSFIRNSWLKSRPEYGYEPDNIKTSRVFVEYFLRMVFSFGRTSFAHWLIEHIPLKIIGPTFNFARKSWKGVSKPTKRKDLRLQKFVIKP